MKIYSDPKNVGSFRGVKNLYREAKKTIKTLTYADVEDFMKGVDSYTLHAKMVKKFDRQNYLVHSPGVILGGDTCMMQKLSDANDGIKYLSVFADMYSRYLYVYPLKTKTAQETSTKLDHLLSNSKWRYSALFVDRGSEYYATPVSKILQKYNMKRYSVYSSDTKNALLEVLIRRLKTRIFRYMTHENTERYIDVLPFLVSSFNESKMVALFNQSPRTVHNMTDRAKIRMLTLKMYKRFNNRRVKHRQPLNVGEFVRISRTTVTQFIFNKAYRPQTTEEIFQINIVDKATIPVTYYLKSLTQEPVLGKFYREELKPVHLPKQYRIKILKTVGKGKQRKHLVAWLGYPSTYNSYIKHSDIINETRKI